MALSWTQWNTLCMSRYFKFKTTTRKRRVRVHYKLLFLVTATDKLNANEEMSGPCAWIISHYDKESDPKGLYKSPWTRRPQTWPRRVRVLLLKGSISIRLGPVSMQQFLGLNISGRKRKILISVYALYSTETDGKYWFQSNFVELSCYFVI